MLLYVDEVLREIAATAEYALFARSLSRVVQLKSYFLTPRHYMHEL